MSARAKRARKDTLPYLTARLDNKFGAFAMLTDSLYYSPRFQQLPLGARWLYMGMALKAGGKFDTTFCQADMKRAGFDVKSARRWMQDLVEGGFVEVAENWKHAGRKNVYRFSLAWRQESGRHK